MGNKLAFSPLTSNRAQKKEVAEQIEFSNPLPVDMSYRDVAFPLPHPSSSINKVSPHLLNLKEDLDFCYHILPGVSRTFAISISHLKGNLHWAVFTGYLFCRMADTIEDAWDVPLEIKQRLFEF